MRCRKRFRQPSPIMRPMAPPLLNSESGTCGMATRSQPAARRRPRNLKTRWQICEKCVCVCARDPLLRVGGARLIFHCVNQFEHQIIAPQLEHTATFRLPGPPRPALGQWARAFFGAPELVGRRQGCLPRPVRDSDQLAAARHHRGAPPTGFPPSVLALGPPPSPNVGNSDEPSSETSINSLVPR